MTTRHDDTTPRIFRFGMRSALVLSLLLEACALEWNLAPPEKTPESNTTGLESDSGVDVTTPVQEDPVDAGTQQVLDAAVPDAEIFDARVLEDAGEKVDASGCQPTDCDCDDDGYNDLTKAGCADAGGPNDCDDTDTRTHPNQDFVSEPGEAPRNGDWNCVNGVEKLYPTGVSCGLLALGACAGVQGFSGDPACGVEGAYTGCKVQAGLFCVAAPTSPRKQACR